MAYPGAAWSGMPSAPGMFDMSQFITEGLLRPITDGIRQAAANFTDSMSSASGPGMSTPGASMWQRPAPQWGWQRGGHQHHYEHGCKCGGHGCEECRSCCDPHDSCHCQCCISDADLIIYSRLGERRVVPLRIENTRRRERQITLELSKWTTHGGKLGSVMAALEPPAPEFKLGPCESRIITLAVETHFGIREEGERSIDVDDCTVYYADLRVEGCDIRPIRIALALLPRDCNVYDISCGCSCCC
jgi:hypothetical protein